MSMGILQTSATPVMSVRKLDRKSTRLNSSHTVISYAVFCLKKEEHTYELQSHSDLVCLLLIEINKCHASPTMKQEIGNLRDTHTHTILRTHAGTATNRDTI